MKKRLLVVFLSFLSLSCQRSSLRQDIPENCKLLKQVLTNPDTSGRYTIVKARTNLEIDPAPRGYITDIRSKTFHFFLPTLRRFSLKSDLRIPGYNVGPLVDVLFDINRKTISLEIESDTIAGYFIDKENRFVGKYYTEHPNAWGFTTVSIPAFDKEAGIVLVYKGTWLAPLAASGWVIAYRLSEGKLI